jgi:4-carboxymuconolactone decarboxylase
MSDEIDYDKAGAAIQTQLWGERVGGSTAPAMPGAQLAPDYFALVRKFCFGMFWSRPNLALRDRSMITCAMLAALGRQDELAGHLRGALNAGVKREELIEVLMQVGVYAGVPMGVAALNTAGAVLGTE